MIRHKKTRILCANCNLCVNNQRRYHVLELDPRVCSYICNWVYPYIITAEDIVCEACWEIAIAAVNQALQREVNSPDGQQATSSVTRGHSHVCILCGCSILRRQSDLILRENSTELQMAMITIIKDRIAPRQIVQSDRVCHPCWLRIQREVQRRNIVDAVRVGAEEVQQLDDFDLGNELHEEHQENPVNVDAVVQNPGIEEMVNDSLTLPNYRRAANTSNNCVFPNCGNHPLRTISDHMRATVLSNYNYYLPILARVCDMHLARNAWDTLYNSENSANVFTRDQVEHIFSFVNAFNPTLNFNNIEEMDERLLKYWVGYTKNEFNILLNDVPRVKELQRGILGLAAFLIKLRTGDSNERISSLLQVPRRTLEQLMDKVREVLLQDFVPRNLGINHMTREELLQRNLLIPKALYGDECNRTVILICDGTYLYINKSSNYTFQKQTYSLHKYRNLVKPFLVVASDGYILDCFGPYKATTSDAEIMKSLFNQESPLHFYLEQNDAFILDKGFRDSIGLLEECGYRPYMPESLLEGEHQLTTEQANRTRCITLCRWVVEVVNGYFKRDFKLFRNEYFNKSTPHIMSDFQIAAALLNRFGVRLRDNAHANEFIEIVRERFNFMNNLADMVENFNLNRRHANFRSITVDHDNILRFPRFEYDELILFALGNYQLRQARSYYGEHIRFHGGYRIEVAREQLHQNFPLRGSGDTSLIRGKIKSRHISRRQYYVYLLIENNIPGRMGVPEYCCSCLVGRRTIGCCAHIMTLVWYLGWARHQRNINAPAEFQDEILIREEQM